MLVFCCTFEKIEKFIFGCVDFLIFYTKQAHLIVHVSSDALTMTIDVLSDDVLLLIAHDTNRIRWLQFIVGFDDYSRIAAPFNRIFGLTTVDLYQTDVVARDVVLLAKGLLVRFHLGKGPSFLSIVHQND